MLLHPEAPRVAMRPARIGTRRGCGRGSIAGRKKGPRDRI